MSINFTRQDYLAGKCSHTEYYGQFVTEGVRSRLRSDIGWKRIIESRDEHFNDIPLQLWDHLLLPYGVIQKIREAGDYLTLAGKVCIYKAAAQQMRDEFRKKQDGDQGDAE